MAPMSSFDAARGTRASHTNPVRVPLSACLKDLGSR